MTETQSPQPSPEIGADAPPSGTAAPAMPPHIPAQRQAQGYPPPGAMPSPHMLPPPIAAPAPSRPLGAVVIAAAILAVGVAALLVWVFVIHPSDASSAPTSSTSTPYSPSTTPDTSTGITSGTTYDDYSSSADSRFVTTLNSNGIPITDAGTRSSAITAGHSVCQGFDGGLSAAQLVNSIYTGTAFSQYQSGVIVGASVGAYCPRHLDLLPK